MATEANKKNHWLAKGYQRGWADPFAPVPKKLRPVWVLDKSIRLLEDKRPGEIGYEIDLYNEVVDNIRDTSVETEYFAPLDSRFAEARARLDRSRATPSSSDWETFIEFACVMHARGPVPIAAARGWLNLASDHQVGLLDYLTGHELPCDQINSMRANPVKLMLWFSQNALSLWRTYTRGLIYAAHPPGFLTCDYPVQIARGGPRINAGRGLVMNIGAIPINVFMPISPQFALFLCEGPRGPGVFKLAEKNLVDQINKQTLARASRYAISSSCLTPKEWQALGQEGIELRVSDAFADLLRRHDRSGR